MLYSIGTLALFRHRVVMGLMQTALPCTKLCSVPLEEDSDRRHAQALMLYRYNTTRQDR